MTPQQAHEFYNKVCLEEQPEVRKDFEECVERFRIGFFNDGPEKCKGNYDESFARAVAVLSRFLTVVRTRNGFA